jgi:hypothetical protein
VAQSLGIVRLNSTTAADRHPSICLGGMMRVEPSPDRSCFGRYHDSPLGRRTELTPSRKDGATLEASELVLRVPPYFSTRPMVRASCGTGSRHRHGTKPRRTWNEGG